MYVSKFTEEFTRMKEILLLESKNEAVDFLRFYSRSRGRPA